MSTAAAAPPPSSLQEKRSAAKAEKELQAKKFAAKVALMSPEDARAALTRAKWVKKVQSSKNAARRDRVGATIRRVYHSLKSHPKISADAVAIISSMLSDVLERLGNAARSLPRALGKGRLREEFFSVVCASQLPRGIHCEVLQVLERAKKGIKAGRHAQEKEKLEKAAKEN